MPLDLEALDVLHASNDSMMCLNPLCELRNRVEVRESLLEFLVEEHEAFNTVQHLLRDRSGYNIVPLAARHSTVNQIRVTGTEKKLETGKLLGAAVSPIVNQVHGNHASIFRDSFACPLSNRSI